MPNGKTPHDDELLTFADEQPQPAEPGSRESSSPWKILIVDDEENVHQVTEMVLRDVTFDDRPLQFISAYSGQEARKLLLQHPDTAVILLDVVMETDDSGLLFVQYVREELKNLFVRIILRTGQPGRAPEQLVIRQYDINDYREKTELTFGKLYTTVIASLRSYRDILTINNNRQSLQRIIEASSSIFKLQSMQSFASGILSQICSILNANEDSLYCKIAGLTATWEKNSFHVLAATGEYSRLVDAKLEEVLPAEDKPYLEQALREQRSLFFDHKYLGFFQSPNGSQNLMYLSGLHHVQAMDRQLIEIFCSNISVAFDNFYLKKDIEDTQKDVIYILGETLEARSTETGHHVKRVSEYSYLLAQKLGLSDEDCTMIKFATPMHDMGKVAIPDYILNKPVPLSPEESQKMKRHVDIGHAILKSSNRAIMQAAAIIALQHHERWDGKGYPGKLKGEEIHIYGRITAIADVFDAINNNRTYRPAMPLEKTLEYIRNQRGLHFDPVIVDLFLENIDDILVIKERFKDDPWFVLHGS